MKNQEINPLISVILPVYNGEKYIKDCINSILNQTYFNFELIIINDGSTDNTLNIIKNFKDDRIIIIDRENKGLIYSLNEGISKSKGKYIARMDADDICFKHRFEKQIDILENENIDICGTNVILLKENELLQNHFELPITHEDIQFSLFFHNCMIHPTIMFKKEILKDLKYDLNFKYAEDYKLWTDLMLTHKVKFKNLKKKLLFYRIHDESTTIKNKINMIEITNIIKNEYCQKQNEYLYLLFHLILNDYQEIDSSNKQNNIKNLFEYLNYLKQLKNVSTNIFFSCLLSFIRNNNQKYNLILLYQYLKFVKKYSYYNDITQVLFLLLFPIKKDSKIYLKLKNIYLKIKYQKNIYSKN